MYAYQNTKVKNMGFFCFKSDCISVISILKIDFDSNDLEMSNFTFLSERKSHPLHICLYEISLLPSMHDPILYCRQNRSEKRIVCANFWSDKNLDLLSQINNRIMCADKVRQKIGPSVLGISLLV